LYFAKIWLARRFTAPGCEPVCCDGNSPMPFARGAFRYAMCSDAFMYIWTKRQFVQDMLRVTDNRDDAGRSAAVISHTHNQCTWTPSHGQPLTPDGYRNLFETIEPRIFGESALFADVVGGGPLDLSRRADAPALEADPALTIVASRHPGLFLAHALEPSPATARGEFRVNPLYVISGAAGGTADPVLFRLQFPSDDYEQEYGACRRYLPDEVAIGRDALSELGAGRVPAGLADLVRRRVIVDLPRLYDTRPF
jgi:hypothetical protein